MKPYTYLLIDLSCLIIPFVAGFFKKFPFYKEWKYFIPANLGVALVFLAWDAWFTCMGVWGFNPDYITGIYLINLPIEEILFFICIPYACVFTYFVIKRYLTPHLFLKWGSLPLHLLILLCFSVVVWSTGRLYTCSTSLLLLITLIYIKLKGKDFNLIWTSYVVILPFFFLSNGLLTGMLMDAPIVWYNDQENLGVRMFTIPIEDVFYGFLLILLNVLFYEHIRSSIMTKASNKMKVDGGKTDGA